VGYSGPDLLATPVWSVRVSGVLSPGGYFGNERDSGDDAHDQPAVGHAASLSRVTPASDVVGGAPGEIDRSQFRRRLTRGTVLALPRLSDERGGGWAAERKPKLKGLWVG